MKRVKKLEDVVNTGGHYTAQPFRKFNTKSRPRQREIKAPSFSDEFLKQLNKDKPQDR